MKRGTFGLVLVTVIAAFLLAGCGCFMQAQKGEAPPPKPPEQKVVAAPEAKKEVSVPGKPTPPAPPPSSPAAAGAPMLQIINFDYDKYNVRPGDAEILKKNLDWFKSNPATKTRIEGNCDERGTVEYNLALGQKRADSAKNYLTGLGVDGKRLETISYGKERPLDPAHNEAAWAKNRNAQFVPIK